VGCERDNQAGQRKAENRIAHYELNIHPLPPGTRYLEF